MPCFLACEAPKTAVFTVFFWSRRLSNISETPQCGGFRGPARITSIINNSTTASIWACFFCFIFFCRCWCGDALYTDTLLQTDDLTHSSLFMHRRLYTQTLLQRETFAQNSFYTRKKSFPPRKKQANMCLSLDLFVSWRFPSRLRNANG